MIRFYVTFTLISYFNMLNNINNLPKIKYRPWVIMLLGTCAGFAFSFKVSGQISPPGLSDTRLASWMAIGLDQNISKDQSWSSVSYVGYGYMSNPHGRYNIFGKPSMFIFNEEVKKKLSQHVSLTGALSFRGQYLYNKQPPYHKATPGLKKEFRAYGKFTYHWNLHKTKWNIDFRPEFRRFFLPEYDADDTRHAIRTRFKVKSSIPLNEAESQFLILSAESLFQNERTKAAGNSHWSGFFYDDSRFAIYFRYAPKDWPLYADIGYMNNLAGKDPTYAMHHIAVDIMFRDLF